MEPAGPAATVREELPRSTADDAKAQLELLPYFRSCRVSLALVFQRRLSSRPIRLFERASIARSSRSSLR